MCRMSLVKRLRSTVRRPGLLKYKMSEKQAYALLRKLIIRAVNNHQFVLTNPIDDKDYENALERVVEDVWKGEVDG